MLLCLSKEQYRRNSLLMTSRLSGLRHVSRWTSSYASTKSLGEKKRNCTRCRHKSRVRRTHRQRRMQSAKTFLDANKDEYLRETRIAAWATVYDVHGENNAGYEPWGIPEKKVREHVWE